MADIEPGIDLPEPPEALDHESRAREQDDRQADFPDHETPSARWRPPPAPRVPSFSDSCGLAFAP